MKKNVCIYPKDQTTDFLLPLYEHICNNMYAIGIHDDTTEENALDRIYSEIHDAESVVFLGHGTSDWLCGSRFENVIFEKEKCDLLCNKRLFLLACNSNQFIKKYDLHCAVGFGFLPTSLRDARYVKKPAGARPGYVIFTHNRTVYVDPKLPGRDATESSAD